MRFSKVLHYVEEGNGAETVKNQKGGVGVRLRNGQSRKDKMQTVPGGVDVYLVQTVPTEKGGLGEIFGSEIKMCIICRKNPNKNNGKRGGEGFDGKKKEKFRFPLK